MVWWRDLGDRIVFGGGDRRRYQMRPGTHPALRGTEPIPAASPPPAPTEPRPSGLDPERLDFSHLDLRELAAHPKSGAKGRALRTLRPKWPDVETRLDEVIAGAHGSVWLSLDNDTAAAQPALWVAANGKDLYLSFRSEEFELAAGEKADRPTVRRVFALFFRERRLDPADGWHSI